jgi:hypothetical protein
VAESRSSSEPPTPTPFPSPLSPPTSVKLTAVHTQHLLTTKFEPIHVSRISINIILPIRVQSQDIYHCHPTIFLNCSSTQVHLNTADFLSTFQSFVGPINRILPIRALFQYIQSQQVPIPAEPPSEQCPNDPASGTALLRQRTRGSGRPGLPLNKPSSLSRLTIVSFALLFPKGAFIPCNFLTLSFNWSRRFSKSCELVPSNMLPTSDTRRGPFILS